MNHLAPARCFSLLHFRAWSHAFVNASLCLMRYLQKSSFAVVAHHIFMEGDLDLEGGSRASRL